jgi:hypothetical protein
MPNQETKVMETLRTPAVQFEFGPDVTAPQAVLDAFDAWLVQFVANTNPKKPNGKTAYFTPSDNPEVQLAMARGAVRTCGFQTPDPETGGPKLDRNGVPYPPNYSTRFWADNGGRAIFVRPDGQTPIDTLEALGRNNRVILTIRLDGIKYGPNNISLAWTIVGGMVTEFASDTGLGVFVPSFYRQFAVTDAPPPASAPKAYDTLGPNGFAPAPGSPLAPAF